MRAFLVGFANTLIYVVIVLGTLGGFVSGLNVGFLYGIIGAIVGFLVSAASMCVLAILVDIRDTLVRIEQARTGV